jgi:hypothetical protein
MPSNPNDTEEFEAAIREMAADPQVRAECEEIARNFAEFESDGLPDD